MQVATLKHNSKKAREKFPQMDKNFDFIKFFETFPVLCTGDYALNEKLKFSRICMESIATFVRTSNFQRDTLLGYDPDTGMVLMIKVGSSHTLSTVSNFYYEKILNGYQYTLVMKNNIVTNSIPKTKETRPHCWFHDTRDPFICNTFGQINKDCARLIMFHEDNKVGNLEFSDFEGLTEKDFAKVQKSGFPGVYFCRNADIMGDHLLFIGENICKVPLNSYKKLFKGRKVIARLMDQNKIKELKTFYS